MGHGNQRVRRIDQLYHRGDGDDGDEGSDTLMTISGLTTTIVLWTEWLETGRLPWTRRLRWESWGIPGRQDGQCALWH